MKERKKSHAGISANPQSSSLNRRCFSPQRKRKIFPWNSLHSSHCLGPLLIPAFSLFFHSGRSTLCCCWSRSRPIDDVTRTSEGEDEDCFTPVSAIEKDTSMRKAIELGLSFCSIFKNGNGLNLFLDGTDGFSPR